MYFFFHLATGIILGFLIAELLHDRRWVVPCAVGAVLPDLIDKPLGLLLFADSIGNGRIWFHTLLIFGVLAVTGLVIRRRLRSPVVLGVAAGILSHQALDLMWRQRVSWFYPLFGSFPQGTMDIDYFFILFSRDLGVPSEWFLVLLILALLVLYLERDQFAALSDKQRRTISVAARIGSLALILYAIIVIALPFLRKRLLYTGWSRPEDYIIGGIVIALAAYLLWRWQRELGEKRRRNEES